MGLPEPKDHEDQTAQVIELPYVENATSLASHQRLSLGREIWLSLQSLWEILEITRSLKELGLMLLAILFEIIVFPCRLYQGTVWITTALKKWRAVRLRRR